MFNLNMCCSSNRTWSSCRPATTPPTGALRYGVAKDMLMNVFFFFGTQFEPDLVIVSAGYDSALGDEKVDL